MMKDDDKEPLLGKPSYTNSATPFEEPPPRAAHKIKRKITVEPAVIGFFVAVTAANPLNQQYLHARFSYELNYSREAMEGNSTECGENYNVEPDSLAQQVQAMTSFWNIILLASDLLPALFTTIILGPYSDKAGRKRAMIPPLIGGTIRTLVTFFVVAFNLPLEFMFIGTVCEGLCGGAFTMMMASFAYMADVTTKRQRPLHLFAIDLCSGLGSTAANISVGYMISALGYKFPYLIVLGIFVLTSIYVICFLPETIDKQPDVKLFTCENLSKGLQVISKKTENKRRWKIILTLIIFSMVAMLDFGGTEIVTFYLLNPPLCWNSVLIGFFISEAYIMMTIGGVICVKFLFPRVRECGLVICSCLSGLLYYYILAGSKTNLMAYMAPIGGMAFKIGLPMIRTMDSKLVEPHEQGSIFSIISIINLLSVVLGNVLFNSVYSRTLSYYHGFMYFVGGTSFLLPALLTILLAIRLTREKNKNKELAEEERLIQEAFHKGQRGSVIGH